MLTSVICFVHRKSGCPLEEIAATKPDYLDWMLREDFFDDTKAVVAEAMAAVCSDRSDRDDECGGQAPSRAVSAGMPWRAAGRRPISRV
jgi:hypothetical protein